MTGLSWSNSNLIAVAVNTSMRSGLVILRSDATQLGSFQSKAMLGVALSWLPDSRSLLYSTEEGATGKFQLWLQPYPSGSPLRFTNDLSSYDNVSVSGDGKSFAATEQRLERGTYVGRTPANWHDRIDRDLSVFSHAENEGDRIAWTGSGQLVEQDESGHLYFLSVDGTSRTPALVSGEAVSALSHVAPVTPSSLFQPLSRQSRPYGEPIRTVES